MSDSNQGMTGVRKGHEFDVSSLEKYLRNERVLIGSGGSLEVKQFKSGQSNPTFYLRDGRDGKEFVMRKKPKGKLLKSAHMVCE